MSDFLVTLARRGAGVALVASAMPASAGGRSTETNDARSEPAPPARATAPAIESRTARSTPGPPAPAAARTERVAPPAAVAESPVVQRSISAPVTVPAAARLASPPTAPIAASAVDVAPGVAPVAADIRPALTIVETRIVRDTGSR